ncbi:thioredoxin domain-containing protein [Rhodohalobacter sp. SW132]|uniref:thioredoxin domain-containing protein n=1 Tax=Rhodohalobacter sp. SW132 TaxID=2293433 RepID=UPI000E23BCBC|nr:thioredoxin domain-containing protein [Rhodohalobacter sp. SW132]REL33536.1 thioredoxin domain-containing protein [Rhodohalobacter sp. SW132]
MNRLSKEKSPYLLQHANNPVDWFPWGDEAFEEAKRRDCPVFLSIGYATCHWCHVMEHESFEDEQVAELMNDAFVNIKVDREERPDIDNTYMTVCQMLTGQGGWPLTIIMTPDKEPFFAATYIPKQSNQRMQGMIDFVPQISKIWMEKRERVMDSVSKIKNGFSKSLDLGSSKGNLSDGITDKAVHLLKGRFDEAHGGFGSQPKFPSPHNLLFLLRYADFHNDTEALEMVEKTLTQMRLGGIWDHIGGGFHRYSTDAEWLLPHFEKMLYDQAMLLLTYAEAWRNTENPLYKETCYDIFRYLNRKMKSPEGGYYSAEDADSEGEEGKFYVWEKDEILDQLMDHDAETFCEIYNIREKGNFRDEATGQFTGKNIPHLNEPLETIAEKRGENPADLEKRMQQCRNLLHDSRETRVYPLLDDKILTDWNGLLMAALAAAGAIFEDTEFTEAAIGIEKFISEKMTGKSGALLHRFRDGDAAIEGMADDYCSVIWGLIELHQTTYDPHYLEKAIWLQDKFSEQFLDTEYGGYFFTSESGETLLGRQKEIYDGALPSSNSIAALNTFRLARLTGNMDYDSASEQIFSAFSKVIEDNPAGYTSALTTQLVKENQPVEVVISGSRDSEEFNRVIGVMHKADRWKHSLILKTPQNSEKTEQLSPFLQSFPGDEKIAIYVCRNFACEQPVHTAEDLQNLLDDFG